MVHNLSEAARCISQTHSPSLRNTTHLWWWRCCRGVACRALRDLEIRCVNAGSQSLGVKRPVVQYLYGPNHAFQLQSAGDWRLVLLQSWWLHVSRPVADFSWNDGSVLSLCNKCSYTTALPTFRNWVNIDFVKEDIRTATFDERHRQHEIEMLNEEGGFPWREDRFACAISLQPALLTSAGRELPSCAKYQLHPLPLSWRTRSSWTRLKHCWEKQIYSKCRRAYSRQRPRQKKLSTTLCHKSHDKEKRDL